MGKSGQNQTFKDKKREKALAALMTSRTMKDAAEAAGIDPRTMRRYMQDADFIAEYRQMTAEMMQEARIRSQQLITPAIETLAEICLDDNAKNGERITAARSLLEWSLKITEVTDIEERLVALENAERGRN